MASGTLRVAIASFIKIVCTLRSRPGRSCQGFSRTMTNAAFEADVPEIRSNADDRDDRVDARYLPRDLLMLRRDRDRAHLRRGVRQDHLHEHGALVLVGHEARRVKRSSPMIPTIAAPSTPTTISVRRALQPRHRHSGR